MTDDARFEDGGERALNLGAFDIDDVQVLSALCQDAVCPVSEIKWSRKAQRFSMLVNRLRREDGRLQDNSVERVQSVLIIENALSVASQGIARGDHDVVLSLLTISFEVDDQGGGAVLLTLAGDGAFRVTVEALELRLKDVTRPYIAPSGKLPSHPD